MLVKIIELSLAKVSKFGGDMSFEDYRCGLRILHAVVPDRLNQLRSLGRGLGREGCVQTFQMFTIRAARARAQFYVNAEQVAMEVGHIRTDMRRKLAQIEDIVRP